jgi:hypothetical protein
VGEEGFRSISPTLSHVDAFHLGFQNGTFSRNAAFAWFAAPEPPHGQQLRSTRSFLRFETKSISHDANPHTADIDGWMRLTQFLSERGIDSTLIPRTNPECGRVGR